jgi:hypothetical protein
MKGSIALNPNNPLERSCVVGARLVGGSKDWYAEHMKTQDRDFVRYIIDNGKVNLTHPPVA